MTFIDVPEPIRDEIASFELPFGLEDQLYAKLEEDLAENPELKCTQFPEPGSPLIYYCGLQDPLIAGTEHVFTIYLTYTGAEDHLVVRQCEYQQFDAWSVPDDAPETWFGPDE